MHFDNGAITWPRDGKKPNYLLVSAETKDLLVPPGVYVLVKRFSAKEEKRRVSAALCIPEALPEGGYAFENHLNYYHDNGHGLPVLIAKGLAAYLNSSLVDSYFRQFSGHTQVNASDLRNLPYPDRDALQRIGRSVGECLPSQEDIDQLIAKELSHVATDEPDPLPARKRIDEALSVLKVLGLPRAQQNDRSALTLLALADVKPGTSWADAASPLTGITPIMDFAKEHYGTTYAPNTRETFRRQTMHQFVEAAIALYNPDKPDRPVNSPKAVYQIAPLLLDVLRAFGTKSWDGLLKDWLASVDTLKVRYAREREMAKIPLKLPTGQQIELSPGGQNVLVEQIIHEFCPRFTPGGAPLYIGDTEEKYAFFDKAALAALGVSVDSHGKMPDVVVHETAKNWLVLIEAVTSHGPVDGKRRDELKRLFAKSKAPLVFVTAFMDRSAMVRFLGDISWETEVWVADAPSHMIHFNGERFLGPYED
jgi:adenine-specific DNA-methyltransferase